MAPTFSSKPPFILRARKAFMAGAAAAAGAFFTSFVAETPKTRDGWIALAAAAVGIGVAAGWSTYKVRNTATVQGSDPLPAPRPVAPPSAEPRSPRWPA